MHRKSESLDIICIFYTQEKESTSEKNRSLCDNVRRRGRLGYGKLKEWLRQTHQEELADVLECIEDERDYTKLLETIHQKMINKIEKGIIHISLRCCRMALNSQSVPEYFFPYLSYTHRY